MHDRKYIEGHLGMLLATIMWGAMSPIAKGVLESGAIDGLELSVIRIGGGTILFLLISLLPRKITGDCKVARKDFGMLFLASIIMISLNQGLYIIGIQYTSPVDTSVMCTLTPVFTLLLAALFIGQPLTLLKVTGIVIGLVGALIMAFTTESAETAINPMLGDILCILAQICAAVYYVFFLGLIKKYPPFTIMKWMFLFSALTYVPGVLAFTGPINLFTIDYTGILSLLYIIIFPTFLSYLIIPFSQKVLKPTVVSSYAYLQPVVATLLASIMGLAIFGLTRIIATVMIFAGVYLVSFSMSRKNTGRELNTQNAN